MRGNEVMYGTIRDNVGGDLETVQKLILHTIKRNRVVTLLYGFKGPDMSLFLFSEEVSK